MGGTMFGGCKNLQSFNYNLPKLTNGNNMFNGCSSLEEFLIDISSVQNGYDMFQNCPKLRKFTSKLTSLTDGQWMFYYSKLDKDSVINIITSLKEDNICDTGSPLLHIGIDRNLATDSELLTFLGISSGTNQTITLTNPKGINWAVSLYWN